MAMITLEELLLEELDAEDAALAHPADEGADLITGWPEYGELQGKRVRLTRAFVKGLDPQDKSELIIGEGEDRVRPFRFASQGSDYALERSRPKPE